MAGFNGSGVWSRLFGPTGWVTDKNNNINIDSTRMDNEWSQITSGFNTTFCRDGQATATGDWNLGGYKITNYGTAAARTSIPSLGQTQDNGATYGGTAGGSANVITFNLTPAITAYAAGQMFSFIAAAANTSSATVNINGVGAKALTRNDATALLANDIKTGQLVTMVYDGTQFQLLDKVVQGGALIAIQYLISSGTYTPTAGTKSTVAGMVGGGGGGSGALFQNSASAGCGGGSGAFAITTISNPTAVSYTIGAGGSAGPASGANAGGNGGSTIFNSITCGGGVGGQTASSNNASGSFVNGPAGGAVSGGSPSLSIPGQRGGLAYCLLIATPSMAAFSGTGGNALDLGSGGAGVTTWIADPTAGVSNVAGNAAVGYGAGGGGAVSCTNATTGAAGGAGAPGIIIAYEYS